MDRESRDGDADPQTRILETAVSLAGNTLLRAGIAFAGQQVGKVFGQQTTDPTPQEHYS